MGMSKQLTFTLACAVALSAIVPGAAGYLSARLEAVESAERNLHAVEARLHARMAREARSVRPVSLLAPCRPGQVPEQVDRQPVAAFVPDSELQPHGRLGGRWAMTPVWLPDLLEELQELN
jgi:hypothetical protein